MKYAFVTQLFGTVDINIFSMKKWSKLEKFELGQN